jgi:organic radical activating enzyme
MGRGGGGGALLQVDKELVDMLKDQGFGIAVETVGTRALPCARDWGCCSPKAGTPLVLAPGDPGAQALGRPMTFTVAGKT